MKLVCCACRRHNKNGEWVQLHELEEHRLSHGYCPSCYEKIIKRAELIALHSSSGRIRGPQ
jgi:hypothetical protein